MASDNRPEWMDKPWSTMYRAVKMAYGCEPVLPEGQDPPDLSRADLLTRMEWQPVLDRLERLKQEGGSQD